MGYTYCLGHYINGFRPKKKFKNVFPAKLPSGPRLAAVCSTPYLSERGVEKPAPRLTKILTEAAINTRGWDGPQAQVQHTCPRPKAEGRCADAGLGSIPAEGVDCS